MDEVLTELEDAWRRTDELFGLLAPEALFSRGIPLRHPFIFYLGHLPAFAWNQLSAVTADGPFDAALDELFERGIDPEDATEAAALAPGSWPAVEAVERYRDAIRAAIPALAARLPALAQTDPLARWVLPLVLEHELMHHETLLYMICRLPVEQLRAPPTWAQPELGQAVAQRRVDVDAGWVTLGAERDAQPFGWDNEFPSEAVQVPAFSIDHRPVTVGEFAEFVQSGGYRDSSLWSAGGAAWVARAGLSHPDNWRSEGGSWQVRSPFAWHEIDDAAGWPAQLSLAEARAWCRWRGDRRLPTEAELHRAAFTTPEGGQRPLPWGGAEPSAERAAVDFVATGPVPAGSRPAGCSAWGAHELVGNGWEWTDTPFAPREGFVAHLRTYPGYSADFFDGKHAVVFGGSWATARRLIRPSFRNWYQPHYPYVFTSFRTVAD